ENAETEDNSRHDVGNKGKKIQNPPAAELGLHHHICNHRSDKRHPRSARDAEDHAVLNTLEGERKEQGIAISFEANSLQTLQRGSQVARHERHPGTVIIGTTNTRNRMSSDAAALRKRHLPKSISLGLYPFPVMVMNFSLCEVSRRESRMDSAALA